MKTHFGGKQHAAKILALEAAESRLDQRPKAVQISSSSLKDEISNDKQNIQANKRNLISNIATAAHKDDKKVIYSKENCKVNEEKSSEKKKQAVFVAKKKTIADDESDEELPESGKIYEIFISIFILFIHYMNTDN